MFNKKNGAFIEFHIIFHLIMIYSSVLIYIVSCQMRVLICIKIYGNIRLII